MSLNRSGYVHWRERQELATGLSLKEALGEVLGMSVADAEQRRAPFMEWSLKVPEPKAGVLDLDRFPFQRELYQATATDSELVIKKATQIGVSAYLLRWALYLADTRGATSLYVFPTKSDVWDFCQHEDEQVLMADGTLRRIADVRVGDRVWSSDGRKVTADIVEAVWDRGRQEIRRVELAGGRSVRATVNHQVYSNRGWVTVGELRVDDMVCVPHVTPEPEHPTDVDSDDAFLAALWLAEGGKTGAGFNFTCGNLAVRERARAIAAKRGWDFYEGARLYVGLTMRTRRDDAAPCGFLRRYGLRGMRTETLRVPATIMRAEREAALEFLRTYVACDGYVGSRETTIASASERVIRDLQALAARLGIAATVRSQQPAYPGARRCWVLAFVGADVEAPGKPSVHSSRQSRMARPAARTNALDLAVQHLRFTGATQAQVARRLEVSQAAVSRAERREWCVPASATLGWARVKSVVPDGEAQTHDLTTRRHHAFFTEGALTHNSDARIKPVIDGSDYLRERVPAGHVHNKGLKAVGLGLVYFRGSESKRQLDSVDADAVILDEYDTLVQQNVPDAERRITAPTSMGLIRRVGVPSISDYGIDAEYQRSDQRRWVVRCEGCGERQPITFADNVLHGSPGLAEHDIPSGTAEGPYIGCKACARALDVTQGEWVATYPDRSMRGYHIPRLIVPDADLVAIVKASEEREPYKRQAHFNKDLAETWEGAGNRLTRQEIAAAQRDYTVVGGYSGADVVTMGIDVASTRALNVRISRWTGDRRKVALWIGLADSFDDLPHLMERYGVNCACIDRMPEYRLARAFAERYAGRVFLVGYAQQREVFQPDIEHRQVWVRRTETLDATTEAVRAQRNMLPAMLPEGYVNQMIANVRRVERDELERVTVQYVKTGDDDYMQAEAYDVVAGQTWGVIQATDEARREVYTPLEELMPFERSALSQDDRSEYSSGPDESEYALDGQEAVVWDD